MNKVIFTGARLTRDAVLKQTTSGLPVVQFSVAVNRMKRKGETQAQADFFNCVAWNKTAEFVSKYFGKGSGINIEGHLTSRSYEKNGQRVYVTEVVCDSVEFNGPKVNNQQQNNADSFNAFEQPNDYNNAADESGIPF